MPMDRIASFLVFLVLITIVVSWPVFFYLIRKQARKSSRGGGWRHAAFFLGPLLAPVVFLLFKISQNRQTKQGDLRAGIGNRPVESGLHDRET